MEILMRLFVTPIYAQNPPEIGEAAGLLDGVFDKILPVAGFLALAMLVSGGYMYMISAGDPGKAKQAQGTMTWALIGLVFIALTGMILTVVFDFIGGA